MKSDPKRPGGEVREVCSLDPAERGQLFDLMGRHYLGVTRESFERDLDEKRWVILLRSSGGTVSGFSTVVDGEVRVAGETVRILFSGDTIVDRTGRGTPDLARTWAEFAFGWAESHPGRRSFWLLICSGFRTFRFLPVFFSRFVPNPGGEEFEDWSRLLRVLARSRFGSCYDEETGIVRLPNPTPLRLESGDGSERERQDPETAFFLARNPGWRAGDELACLTQITRANLTRAGSRMLRSTQV